MKKPTPATQKLLRLKTRIKAGDEAPNSLAGNVTSNDLQEMHNLAMSAIRSIKG